MFGQTWTITLDGLQYSGITSSSLLRSVPDGSTSLHLRRSLNFADGEILRGDFDHLTDLLDQCKAAGIPCEHGSVD